MTLFETLDETARAFLASYPPSLICQACFIFAAAAVLAVAALPPSAQHLLTQYGARGSPKRTGDGAHRNKSQDGLTMFLNTITAHGQVPHSWFIHFYMLSVCSSAFWAWQCLSHGHVLGYIATSQAATSHAASMSMRQVVVAWSLMSLQGLRRLYEYLAITKTSSSQMLVVHWLLGNAYYAGIGVAVWIEGSASILQFMAHQPIDFEKPRVVELVSALVFLLTWSMQYRCHKYLASLKKYSLPNEGMFRYLACPHYTCECVLYLSLAVLAAPAGQLYNKTLLCAWIFVTINLGVTAGGTRQWYVEKFGAQHVQNRWRMIPLLY